MLISLDIGGTKILCGLINEKGHILSLKERPTNAHSGADYVLKQCFEMVDELCESNESDAIGIATAGRVNVLTGDIVYATPNLPGWMGLQLGKIFEERYYLPVAVDNDVNAAAEGEKWMGAARGSKSFVCLTLGTGVGGAFKCNDIILHGEHWSGAELGHVILKSGGRQCNCGLKGCIEQYISGTALFKRYNELASETLNSAKDVFMRAVSGDKSASQVIDEFISDTANAILSLNNAFNPEVFVIGGGLLGAMEYWWEDVLKSVHAYDQRIEVLPAQLGIKAGLVGAARLAFKKINLAAE